MRGEEEAVFTMMGSGRCWTMAETKERFQRHTSKKPFPFQFSVSSVSSTTGSFFLSPSSSLNCCLPNPLFFPPTLPVLSLSPFLPPRVPACLSSLRSRVFNVVLLELSLRFPLFSSLHAASLISSVLPSFLACVPPS